MLSLVIPVYRNEENLDRLLAELVSLQSRLQDNLEVVFVVDGSPDRSLEILRERLSKGPLQSRLVSLSRNFGSFSAILAGLSIGSGDHFAVMAADLQEPPDLVLRFHQILKSDTADIVFGCRSKRSDPWLSDLASSLFWLIYRKLVVKEMPKGGVDSRPSSKDRPRRSASADVQTIDDKRADRCIRKPGMRLCRSARRYRARSITRVLRCPKPAPARTPSRRSKPSQTTPESAWSKTLDEPADL
jgi:glycosyltransferase involved in cell wall biosynthesis